MSPNRYRTRGLTNNPLFFQTVKLVNTLFPEEGAFEDSRLSNPDSWASISQPLASVIFDRVDAHGPNANGDYTMARPVYHYKVVSCSLKSFTTEWDVPPYTGVTSIIPRGHAPFGNAGFDDRICPPPPTGTLSRFSVTCMNEMDSQFPPEQDFLSFVLELKSLVSVIDTLADVLNGIRESLKGRPNIRRAARIHAGYNFGVSPILSDFAKVHSTFNRVERRIVWLLENQGKWFRVGAKSSYEIEEDTPLEGFGYAGWSPGVALHRRSQRGVLVSTARVKQEMPDVSSWLYRVRGVIGDLGLDRPLTTFWEQIPFSWAVDYLIPVGDFLRTVGHLTDPFWIVRDPSWSAKTIYDYQFPVGYEGTIFGNMGTLRLSRYHRSVGLPTWEWYLETPTLKQLSLLAAVAILET